MSPRESDPLLEMSSTDKAAAPRHSSSVQDERKRPSLWTVMGASILVALFIWAVVKSHLISFASLRKATGPYRLLQHQTGRNFFDYYDFYQGADSIGSAGYQTYVDSKRATKLNLINVTTSEDNKEEFVFMQSAAGENGTFRESVRLEGKTRFNRGLFILNVAHMPSGCGVWPAFWMTDEDHWPNHGEIDILEGINTQSVVKTALHTSDSCSMYAHVPAWAKTGVWDTSTGLPDTFTGQPNYINRVEADNCWVMAPHQWANQGCVAVSTENGTIGEPMNEIGGGVYVLEWDPVNGYIRSWVFKHGFIPDNLQASMDTASPEQTTNSADSVRPNPSEWPTPYAYFAIGEGSGCSNDHFQDMRLVFNLAFCGTVAGNRFFQDCPALSHQYNVSSDSVLTCNAFIASEPESLKEAYWKIRGVYVYQREYERQSSTQKNKTT